jgi:hypothetical protein
MSHNETAHIVNYELHQISVSPPSSRVKTSWPFKMGAIHFGPFVINQLSSDTTQHLTRSKTFSTRRRNTVFSLRSGALWGTAYSTSHSSLTEGSPWTFEKSWAEGKHNCSPPPSNLPLNRIQCRYFLKNRSIPQFNAATNISSWKFQIRAKNILLLLGQNALLQCCTLLCQVCNTVLSCFLSDLRNLLLWNLLCIFSSINHWNSDSWSSTVITMELWKEQSKTITN